MNQVAQRPVRRQFFFPQLAQDVLQVMRDIGDTLQFQHPCAPFQGMRGAKHLTYPGIGMFPSREQKGPLAERLQMPSPFINKTQNEFFQIDSHNRSYYPL